MRKHIALYGQIKMLRGYCEGCQSTAFIIDGKFACCGVPTIEEDVIERKRISDVPLIRSGPSAKWKEYILEKQEGCCFYCARQFGNRIYIGIKSIRLRVCWDHVDPFVFSLNNQDQNFVAACQICNNIKYSMIFQTVEAAIVYINERRESKGYRDTLPEMPETIPKDPHLE